MFKDIAVPTLAIWIFITLLASNSYATDYTLPLYEFEIDSEHLESLHADPWSSRTYPAKIEYEGESYDCRVRFRGSSARTQGKKSWKFFFDERAPLGRRVINLNSEYRDRTLSRNHIAMELAADIGLDVPETRHVSLVMNGNYMGVFVEIENIDKQYFDSRDYHVKSLYKALTHVARFTPTLNPTDITDAYEPKITDRGSLDTLNNRLAFFHYSAPGSDIDELNRIIDVDNFIKFFAIMYVICNHDGFSKNYYLWRDEDNRYLIIPWDCDATFGNEAGGVYMGYEDKKTFHELVEQSVFQHIIAFPEYRQRMHEVIALIIDNGFLLIEDFVSETYNLIQHDAFLDIYRRGNNGSFAGEWELLSGFMDQRKNYLQDLDWFYRFNVSDLKFTPEYIGDNDTLCTIEIRLAEVPRFVRVAVLDSSRSEIQLNMNDLGEDGDRIAGDFIYTHTIDIRNYPLPISLGIVVISRENDYFAHPPSGWHRLGPKRFPLPVINRDNDPPRSGDIVIGETQIDFTGTFRFPLTNVSQSDKDISGCLVSIGGGYRRLRLPQMESIGSGERIFITNNIIHAKNIFPGENYISGISFVPSEEDTISLLSPGGNNLSSQFINNIEFINDVSSIVVINEINYRSSDEFDTGDWIELYASKIGIDLSQWKITDSDTDHVYIIPTGTILAPNSFLIIARDPDRFSEVNPDLEGVIGGFDFGFSSRMDDVILYDEMGGLIDWVSYSSSDPWPDLRDNTGTLELINSESPNYSVENWRASGNNFPKGTPGRINHQYIYDSENNNQLLIPVYQLISTWPNPFNSNLFISYSATDMGVATFTLYNSLGRQVSKFSEFNNHQGTFQFNLDLSSSLKSTLSAGSYFLRVEGHKTDSFKQIIYLP